MTALPAETASPEGLMRRFWDSAGMLMVFIVLFIVLSMTVEGFLSRENVIALALSVSTVGVIACTMLFCLASGDFDLSVESVVAFSGVLAVVVINATGSIVLGILAGILAGGLVGFVNGAVIALVGINALITTLATMQIVRGLGFIVSGGSAIGSTSESFVLLGTLTPGGVPLPVYIMVVCFVVYGLLLNRTRFGRNTLAIGGSREAARLAGIPVKQVKILIFTLQGMMAAFAGIILASRMASGQPNSSTGLALDVISACVLGGVSLSGGVGTMMGTVVGVLIMGTVQNAMNLESVPTFYQYIARGLILLAAVAFDQLRQRR